MRLALVLVAALASTALASGPVAAFDLQGHRAARGLAPENTLAAVDQALSIGVTTLELDLVVTADDVIVVHHDLLLDPNIARRGDGTWIVDEKPIRSLTLSDLKTYDVGRLRAGTDYARRFADQITRDGARVPTLAEVFERVSGLGADHVRFNLETKLRPGGEALSPTPEAFAALLVEVVEAHGMTDRVTVQSFDWRTLDALAEIAPQIPRVCLTAQGRFDTVHAGRPGPSPWLAGRDLDDHDGSVPALVAAAGCSTWSPLSSDVDAERLAEAKALGLLVVPWTVNELSEMRTLIELGVDGLVTDYPNRLRALLVERGLPTPPQVRVPTR